MIRRSAGAALFAALLVVTAVACSGSGGADDSALPDPSAPVIGVATNAALAGPTDLETFDDTNGHAEVAPGGGYQLGVRAGQSVVTATLARPFPRDQIVTAGLDSTGSPPDLGFGVVCRMQDEDNYYRLGVSNDGQYAIQRVRDGAAKVLTGDGQWQQSSAIRTTAGPFTVRAECVGDTLTLFESNQEIASVEDRSIRGSRAGVFVESFAEPSSVVKVTSLTVRAFRDRRAVDGVAADGWDDLLRTQRVARTCTLLDPKESRTGKQTAFATRCGSVVFVAMDQPQQGAREYARILREAGTTLRPVRGLPDCAKRDGIRGPLPPPTPNGFTDTRTSIGRVACLDLGDDTAVVWLHDLPGVIGVTRVARKPASGWKGYGRDWPPFAYEEQPG